LPLSSASSISSAAVAKSFMASNLAGARHISPAHHSLRADTNGRHNRPKALVATDDIEALAPADGAPTPEEALVAKADAAAIKRAIGALPPPFRKPSRCATLVD
jgi:hypothetical protein